MEYIMRLEIEKILAEYTDGKETLQEATTKVLSLIYVNNSLIFEEGAKAMREIYLKKGMGGCELPKY